MMTKLLTEISTLVSHELERANQDNPPFHSRHEGYAVILEEVNEMSCGNPSGRTNPHPPRN